MLKKGKSEAAFDLFSALHRFKVDQALAHVKRKAQPPPQVMLGLLLLFSFLIAAVLTAWA